MIQEFNLSVTPVGNHQYLIRTEHVPYGAPLGQELVTWPVDQWLEEAQQLMGDPLKGLLQGGTTPDSAGRAVSLVELGQKLYAGLFRDTLRDSWVISQGVAQSRRATLRLRLGLKGSELSRLPWEVMYGTDVPVEQLRQGSITAAPRPMATGTRIIFSRYQLNSRLVEDSFPELTPNQPIRILMVVSAPTDQEQLKLYREVKHMQQELQTASPTAAPAEIQLTILNQPGREELARALEQGRFQVLHYAGHSDLSAAGGSLYLVNSRTGLSEILTGDDLAGLLVNTGIRLAVFNSCRGAYTAADPGSSGNRNLAEALVSRGIPAVLAMAEQIPDNVALNLTRWFYHNLKQGSEIDLSLNRARQGLIATYGSQQFYWALPVLYLHPEFNGHLLAHEIQTNAADRYGGLPAGALGLPGSPARRWPEPLPEPLVPELEQSRLPQTHPAQASVEPTPAQPDRAAYRANQQPVNQQPVNQQPGRESASLASLQSAPLQPEQVSNPPTREAVNQPAITKILEQLSPPVESSSAPEQLRDQPVQQPIQRSEQWSNGTVSGAALVSSDTAMSNPELSCSLPGQVSPHQASSSSPTQAAVPRRRFRLSWLLLPLLGAVAAAAYIGYGLPQELPDWSLPSWLGQKLPAETPAAALIDPTASVEELRATAEVSFRQGQSQTSIEQGVEAVKLLLEQNALEEASVAIAAAPAELKEDARINFLRGRLAWQGMKAADGIHTQEQARDFWERAVAADPNSLDYQQALMFAYYSAADARNLEKAIQTWSAANANPALTSAQALDFAALAALVLQKRADVKPVPERDDHLTNAILLYQKVISRDAQRFAPEALRQNWLWTEAAIKDWQALSQIKINADQPAPAGSTPSVAPVTTPAVSPSASPAASPAASPPVSPTASPARPSPAQ